MGCQSFQEQYELGTRFSRTETDATSFCGQYDICIKSLHVETDAPSFYIKYDLCIRSSHTNGRSVLSQTVWSLHWTLDLFADSKIFALDHFVQKGRSVLLHVKWSLPRARQKCKTITAAWNSHGCAKWPSPIEIIFFPSLSFFFLLSFFPYFLKIVLLNFSFILSFVLSCFILSFISSFNIPFFN